MSIAAYTLSKFTSLYSSSTVSFGGNSYYSTDLTSDSFADLLPRAYEENAAGIRAVLMPTQTIPIEMTNAQYIGIIDSAQDAIQELTDIYYQISQLINNGTITTDAQVDSTWTSLTSSYSNNRIQQPTNETLSNEINSLPSQVQANWTETNSSAADYIQNKPLARSQSSTSRSLNAAFQISSVQDALVNYSVNVSCTISLTSGQSGTVILEISSNSAFTSNVQTLANFVNTNSGTLTIGLNLTQALTATLSGFVPAGYYCRLRTVNNTGSPTFSYQYGQEILM